MDWTEPRRADRPVEKYFPEKKDAIARFVSSGGLGQAPARMGLSSSKDVAAVFVNKEHVVMASDGIWVVAVARARETTPHSGRSPAWNGDEEK